MGSSADELEHDVRAEDGRDAGLEEAPEAVADPSAGLWRGFDEQAPAGEVDLAGRSGSSQMR